MTQNHIRTWLSSALLLFGSSTAVMGQWQTIAASGTPTSQTYCPTGPAPDCPANSTCSSWTSTGNICFSPSTPLLTRTVTPTVSIVSLTDNTKFVGIGTANPYNKLHIMNNSSSLLKLTNSAGSTSAAIDFATFNDANNNTNARIAAIDAPGFNASLAFYTDGDDVQNSNLQERMRITKTGNVGIGTTNPNAQLQLSNSVINRKITLYEVTNDDHQFYGFGINAGILRYQVPTSSNHVFYAGTSTTASTELMRIRGDGNVVIGIPTVTVNEKLHVVGDIKVIGLVKAADICLTPGASCDYVFDNDYELRTLSELKAFIQENKHLPYIPSEKEVVEKGTTFNNMVFAQLRTIEELVLYTIQQQEALKKQEQRIVEMEKVIEKLASDKK